MVSDNKYFVWISYLLAVLAASLVGLFCIYAIAILDMKEAILGIDLIIDATIRDFVRDYFTYLPLMFLTLLAVAFPGFIIVRRIARQKNISGLLFYSISGALYAAFTCLLLMTLNIFTPSVALIIAAGITGVAGGITYGLSLDYSIRTFD
jgi:hypothetical protein